MSSDNNFQEDEAKRQAAVKAQDRADFTAEANGTDNGRVKRLELQNKHQKNKTREKRDQESLNLALKISAKYT